MSLSTRISLVKLARKYDALLISDDVYDFLQWPTDTSSPAKLTHALLPRLVDIDRTLSPLPKEADFGNAVSNGSFSKIAGPGMRTGWAEATRKFTYGLSQAGSSRSGGAPSQMTATIINGLLSSSVLQTHIETILKSAYQKRYRIMMDAITSCLEPLGVRVGEVSVKGQDVFGGYFIWLELPGGVDAEVVSAKAKQEENLIVAPGKIFEVEGDESVRFPNTLRLCFAWEDEADLVEGVERLARVVRGVLKGEGGHEGVSLDKRNLGEFS
jgi:DNA-binding transcriptional MocR family regulator